jgi:hypothetical protein
MLSNLSKACSSLNYSLQIQIDGSKGSARKGANSNKAQWASNALQSRQPKIALITAARTPQQAWL